MRATLERAQEVQAACNCFITICADQALADAAAADRRVAKGGEIGPLHGVPFHVKDLVNTKGVRTTFASYIHEHNVPKEDAVVRRAPEAGRRHPDRPRPRRPSSGTCPTPRRRCSGARAMPGRRTAPAAAPRAARRSRSRPASARSGSAPTPAARRAFPPPATASSGFKQSAGVVPHDMSPEVFANVSSINPMARTVMDTALMLEAMAGQHPSDPYSYGAPSTGFVAAARPEGVPEGHAHRLAAAAGQHGDRQPGAGGVRGGGDVAGRARRRRSSRWTTTWSPSSPSGSPIPARMWNARFRDLLPQWGNRLSPTLRAADGARQGHHRRGRGPRAARAHAALPQGAGLVRALRRDRHADADAHGDPHRGAPVRADRDRGPARPIPCARPGIPTRIPST